MTGHHFATVLVIAKRPEPGRVKTRLVPPLSHEQAARVAGAALRDTLATAGTVPAAARTLVFEGDPAGWVPPGWTVRPQVGGSLDLRLAAAFAAVNGPAADGPAVDGPAVAGPAVLVGMDTPQFTAGMLLPFGGPDGFDACLGMAEDGGFWAIGFADPAVAGRVLPGVPMSTAVTGAVQLRRMRAAGLRVRVLQPLRDVDDIEAARAVAVDAPGTEFARTLAEVDERAGVDRVAQVGLVAATGGGR